MNPSQTLALALDPSRIFSALRRDVDPWQRELLLCNDRHILLNCSRQSGKSTTVSALALHTALFTPNGLVLILSPSHRQSGETYRKVLDAYRALERPIPARHETELLLELANCARIVCLPGREETIRSFSGVSLLVLDEAARVHDDLYRSVRPMLAVSQGRIVALSTPFGQRGWFWRAWAGAEPWKRILVTWHDCPRIRAEFIEDERRALGDAWVQQEYECTFTTMHGLVYPDFRLAVVEDWPKDLPSPLGGEGPGMRGGRRVGGIDFGWRNPFAAVWGVVDRDDVLWIGGERYLSGTPLHEHAAALRSLGAVQWYADPAGRTEIEELRAAGLTVRAGDNSLRPGIAAVTARLRTGRLKVRRAACPKLLGEAALYRYPDDGAGEEPLDCDNHALAALRYLISRLDARFLARLRRGRPEPSAPLAERLVAPDNEDLWTRLS
jgi:hypothetical protein